MGLFSRNKKGKTIQLTPEEKNKAEQELHREAPGFKQDVQQAQRDEQEFTEDELKEISLIASELKTINGVKQIFEAIKATLRKVDALNIDDAQREDLLTDIDHHITELSNKYRNSIAGAFSGLYKDCEEAMRAVEDLHALAKKHDLKNKQKEHVVILDNFEKDILKKSSGLGNLGAEIIYKIDRYAKASIEALVEEYEDMKRFRKAEALKHEKEFRQQFAEAFNMLEVLEARTKGLAGMLKAMQDVARTVHVEGDLKKRWDELVLEIGRGVVYNYTNNEEMQKLMRAAGIRVDSRQRA